MTTEEILTALHEMVEAMAPAFSHILKKGDPATTVISTKPNNQGLRIHLTIGADFIHPEEKN